MDEQVDQTRTSPIAPPLSRETRVASRSRWRGILIGLIVILLAVGAGWYWWVKPASGPAGRSGSGRAAQAPPQLVGAATVGTGDIRIILSELGTVTPLATVTVKTQISGQFTEIGFKEGQLVNKGDFLAQIDPRPYQVALQQASGQLAHDQGLLDQAQVDLKRYQTLGRQDSISQQQVDDQRYLVAQYSGTVQADQAQVNSANLNLTYCHIVAPIAGQVGLRQVDPGNYVQVSDPNGVVVITQMQPISVIFSVPEDNLPDIITRVRAGASLNVAAYDRANVKLLASGQLTTLDNQIDTTTGTLKLRASFANPDELLYPNQFVNARLLVDTMHDAVRLPVAAVQRGEPGTYVYVINADNTASVRPVKLGPTDDGMVAVLSGVKAGERVVTDGTDRLRDGAKVAVADQAKGAGAGSPAGGASPRQPATGQAAPARTAAPSSSPGAATGGPPPGQPATGQPAPAQTAAPSSSPGAATGGSPPEQPATGQTAPVRTAAPPSSPGAATGGPAPEQPTNGQPAPGQTRAPRRSPGAAAGGPPPEQPPAGQPAPAQTAAPPAK